MGVGRAKSYRGLMTGILDIPEVVALDARRALVRIPPEVDVPLTSRVRQIIDTADYRRLGRISQLGLVSLVYPAAIHTRFEHSLGGVSPGLAVSEASGPRRAVCGGR